MHVIVVLDANGNDTWYTVPDGWSVVASEEGGVLFASQTRHRHHPARHPSPSQTNSPNAVTGDNK